ncbi:13593_t:CDS:2, partial [Funneliformis caledonium]
NVQVAQDDLKLKQLRDPNVLVDSVLDKEENIKLLKDHEHDVHHRILSDEYQINNSDDEDKEDPKLTFLIS